MRSVASISSSSLSPHTRTGDSCTTGSTLSSALHTRPSSKSLGATSPRISWRALLGGEAHLGVVGVLHQLDRPEEAVSPDVAHDG